MGLSNYITIALNDNAIQIDSLHSHRSYCYIRKNYLVVCDNTEVIVAEIKEGRMVILDFDVEAGRGPQDSIFVKVIAPDHRTLTGIGCFACNDIGQFVGIYQDTDRGISSLTANSPRDDRDDRLSELGRQHRASDSCPLRHHLEVP